MDLITSHQKSYFNFWECTRSILREHTNLSIKDFKSQLRNLLNLVCDYELRDCQENFGSLFFQIDYLGKKYKLGSKEKFFLQSVRKNTGRNAKPNAKELLFELKVLGEFYAKIHQMPIPEDVETFLNGITTPERSKTGAKKVTKCIKCIIRSVDAQFISVEPMDYDYETLNVDVSNPAFEYLKKIFHEGLVLNLLEVKWRTDNEVEPSYIVVEPDFLIDISSIAQCFADFGHHPLSFIVNKMKRKALSQPILLGNFASASLDDIIHTSESGTYNVNNTIRSNFRDKAIDFCTCPMFNAESFVKSAKDQASNLQQAVEVLFSQYDKDKAILEPTFICEALGIQGRVDLMTIDFGLLIEQKSGKNNNLEWKKEGRRMMSEAHYVQLLLYLGVMMYNFQKKTDSVDVKLLYSRYAPSLGLVNVGFEHKTFLEVLALRNKIVATEFTIAKHGFEKVINLITPSVLNEKKLDSDFYARYLLPPLIEVTSPLQSMSALERAYFCRLATFSYRELMIGKVGRKEGVQNCFADLWNLPTDKKKDAGNIITGLKIKEKRQSSSFSGYDVIVLEMPNQGENFLPNFRFGDMVYLYSYQEDEEPDVRKSILYSGYLSKLESDVIEVRLGDGQKNPDLIDYHSSLFALEHASSDASFNSQLRGLLELVTSPQPRKQLLLGLREPESDVTKALNRTYDPDLDETLLKVKQAKDYFLLIGPPGTGKTHRATKFIIQEELMNQDSNILLLSYTNRAVDEICSMLTEDLGIDFLRLGRSSSCDGRYRRYLINSALDQDALKLEDLKKMIVGTRVFVSTVSYLLSRPNIFALKQFSLALIDEASQILEPDLIGLLCSHLKFMDKCDIDKFVMVGDYKQLPAIVLQSQEESAITDECLNNVGFSDCRMSLFQRLIYNEHRKNRDQFVAVLRKQGRMHPTIAQFPNDMFYADEHLEIVPCAHQTEDSLGYEVEGEPDEMDEILMHNRLVFFASPYNINPSFSDKVNAYEAELLATITVRIALYYGDRFNERQTLGIIVPYRNQIALVRREIEKKIQEYNLPKKVADVTIDTVERYQGSQRDVILFSFTVQHLYQLDFLTSNNFIDDFDKGGHVVDPKLNVVMTRARKQLILTGNVEILQNNSVYYAMLEHIKRHGCYVDA